MKGFCFQRVGAESVALNTGRRRVFAVKSLPQESERSRAEHHLLLIALCCQHLYLSRYLSNHCHKKFKQYHP